MEPNLYGNIEHGHKSSTAVSSLQSAVEAVIRKDYRWRKPSLGGAFLFPPSIISFIINMKNVIRWFFGVIFLFASLTYMSMGVPLAGLFMFIVGSFITPPLGNFITNKLHLRIATKWKVLICVMCAFLGGGIYSQSDAYKKAQTEQAYNKTNITSTVIPTKKPVVITLPPVKVKKAKPQPTKQLAKDELSSDSIKAQVIKLGGKEFGVMGKDEFVKVEVNDDFGSMKANEVTPQFKIVNVYYKPKDVWDEKMLMKYTCRTSAFVSEALLANPKVSKVSVWTLTDFTNSYGKTSEETAVRIGVGRETASNVVWSTFKEMVLDDYNSLLKIADDVYIHPAIQKEL